jgi:hypothetical protein
VKAEGFHCHRVSRALLASQMAASPCSTVSLNTGGKEERDPTRK